MCFSLCHNSRSALRRGSAFQSVSKYQCDTLSQAPYSTLGYVALEKLLLSIYYCGDYCSTHFLPPCFFVIYLIPIHISSSPQNHPESPLGRCSSLAISDHSNLLHPSHRPLYILLPQPTSPHDTSIQLETVHNPVLVRFCQ